MCVVVHSIATSNVGPPPVWALYKVHHPWALSRGYVNFIPSSLIFSPFLPTWCNLNSTVEPPGPPKRMNTQLIRTFCPIYQMFRLSILTTLIFLKVLHIMGISTCHIKLPTCTLTTHAYFIKYTDAFCYIYLLLLILKIKRYLFYVQRDFLSQSRCHASFSNHVEQILNLLKCHTGIIFIDTESFLSKFTNYIFTERSFKR